MTLRPESEDSLKSVEAGVVDPHGCTLVALFNAVSRSKREGSVFNGSRRDEQGSSGGVGGGNGGGRDVFDEDDGSALGRPIAWVVLTPVAVAVGVILSLGALGAHHYNELSDAQRLSALAVGSELAVEVSADVVDPANEGKLIHVTGPAVVREVLTDPEFGVSAEGAQLTRTVQMYQWYEKVSERETTKDDGGTTTVKEYDYATRWSTNWIDSSTFRGAEPKRNPPSMPYANESWQAHDVTVGAFRLNLVQIRRVGEPEDLDVTAIRDHPKVRDGTLKIANGEFYIGRDPAAPEVGDMRISYSVRRPGAVSILASQWGNTFRPFDGWHELRAGAVPSFDRRVASVMRKGASFTRAFSGIDELREGAVSKEEMFRNAWRDRTLLTWGVRVAATLVLIAGLQMILLPFKILLSAIPPVSRLFESARGSTAVRAGIALSVLTCGYVQLTTRWTIDPGKAELFLQISLGTLVVYLLVGPFSHRLPDDFALIKGKGLGRF